MNIHILKKKNETERYYSTKNGINSLSNTMDSYREELIPLQAKSKKVNTKLLVYFYANLVFLYTYMHVHVFIAHIFIHLYNWN